MKGYIPYAVMTVVQLAYAAGSILCKVAIDKGLSVFVLVVYRHFIAMLLLGPFAFVLERKQRPSLTLAISIKIFFLALCGATVHQILCFAGLDYASPTFACALSNLSPGLTFLMAVLLRMENLNIGSLPSIAKLLGTLICIDGALISTFWKGFLFKGLITKPLIGMCHRDPHIGLKHGRDDWIKGSALITSSYVAWSVWLILQAVVCKVYPAQLSMTTLICFFATLQSFILGLVFERRVEAWRLEWNVQLFTIIYCGIVTSAGVYYMLTWCIGKKGPVFVSSFSPLLLVIVGIFSTFLFAEQLHLGSLIGAILIVMGVYGVLWGKSKDRCFVQKEEEGDEESSANQMLKA